MPVDWKCPDELLELIQEDTDVPAFNISPLLARLPIRPTDNHEDRIARIRRHNDVEKAVLDAIEAHNEKVEAAQKKRAEEEQEQTHLEEIEEEEEDVDNLWPSLSYNTVRSPPC